MKKPAARLIKESDVKDSEQIHITRYTVGDCEMLERPTGSYLLVSEIHTLLDWITEHDDLDVMLAKIAIIKEQIT